MAVHRPALRILSPRLTFRGAGLSSGVRNGVAFFPDSRTLLASVSQAGGRAAYNEEAFKGGCQELN